MEQLIRDWQVRIKAEREAVEKAKAFNFCFHETSLALII
jgi:hypothetical protein